MGKGVKGLKLLFATIFGLSTFFTPLDRVSYADVLRRRIPTIINVDEQRKTFTTNPICEEDKKAFDLLSLYFFEKEEDEFKRKTNELEEKIKEFFWKNPTPFPILVKENISSQTFNVQEFIRYQTPEIKVEAVKKGDVIDFEYKLSSQNYFFKWDKSCSVLFISPKGTKLFRKYLDVVYTLDLSEQSKFGDFKETIDKDVALREVADFGVNILYKKHKEDILAALPEIAPVVVLYEISKQIEEMEKENMEKAAGLSRGNIKVFRYSPAVYFPTQNEVGRKMSIGYNGMPERIEVFINSSLAENPLTKQYSGTDTRKDYPKFLKHYSLLPFEPWRGSLVGIFAETEKEDEGLIKEVENKLLKNRGELENYYNRLSGNLHTLNGLIGFLDGNLTSDVSDTRACIDQIDVNINKSRESSKSLHERMSGFEYLRGTKPEEKEILKNGFPEELWLPQEILSYYYNKGKKLGVNLNKKQFIIKLVDYNCDKKMEYDVHINHPLFNKPGRYNGDIWYEIDRKWQIKMWYDL